MRYNNNHSLFEDEVVYMDSVLDGFTCVDLELTPNSVIYSVPYEQFTETFNYILYTTRHNRPAFVIKDGVKFTLNVNDKGGWHLTEYDTLQVDLMGRLGAIAA